jgi:hypothetical protein
MRLRVGAGIRRERAACGSVPLLVVHGDQTPADVIFALDESSLGILHVLIAAERA